MVSINSFSIILIAVLIFVLICINRQEFVEKFSISASIDQDAGASSLFNWGYRPIEKKEKNTNQFLNIRNIIQNINILMIRIIVGMQILLKIKTLIYMF